MKILVALLAIISFGTFAQDAKADKILSNLSAKMKGYSSFYIEFNANVKNSASGMNESNTGKGWVKGNKFHASYGENTRISNGMKSWTILKEEKSVYVSDANEDEDDVMNPKKLMTIWESGFKSKYDKETKVGTDNCHVIYLYPKNPASVEYHTITLYISTTDGELKKAVLKTKDGTYMTYSVTKFQGNASVSDSKFVFDQSKYPGYHIIED